MIPEFLTKFQAGKTGTEEPPTGSINVVWIDGAMQHHMAANLSAEQATKVQYVRTLMGDPIN